jgi:hypothetical protein
MGFPLASLAQSCTPKVRFALNEGSGTSTADAQGNAPSGTLNGPTWVAGQNGGGALSFDGVNDRVTVSSDPDLTGTSLSLMAWIKTPASFSSGPNTIVEHNRFGNNWYGLWMNGNGSSLSFRWGPNYDQSFGPALQPNTWYFVAGTYDKAANAAKMYINGALVYAMTPNPASNAVATSGNFSIGANNQNQEFFKGIIDEVRFYNCVLNPAEINNLYRSNGSSTSLTPALVSTCTPSTPANTPGACYTPINTTIDPYGVNRLYVFKPGTAPIFQEFDNGTAHLSARMVRQGNSNDEWQLELDFIGKTTLLPFMSPHSHDCQPYSASGWVYYPVTTGTMTGVSGTGAAGGVIQFTYLQSNGTPYPAFQIGTGANTVNLNFGASAWVRYIVVQQPSNSAFAVNPATQQADFEWDFSCSPCNVVANAGADKTLTCAATSVTLNGSATPSTGVTYSWTGPNGFTSNQQSPSVSVAGTYTLTVTQTSTGCTDQDEVLVSSNTAAPANVVAMGGTIICNGPAITLSASSSTAGVTYSWSGPNGFSSNQQNPSASVAGIYTLTITNPVNGCTASDTALVNFLNCASLGDFVWYDNDRDGQQDGNEPGVQGVTVQLYLCGQNSPIATDITGANGGYFFDDLTPNQSYYVVFSNLPTDYVFSNANQGNDATDSDAGANGATACYFLSPGENELTVDAGINLPCDAQPGSIGVDQFYCGIPALADTVRSVQDAQCAGGVMPEYEWRYSEDPSIPFEFWVVKPGSNSPDFFPGLVSKDCWVARFARCCPGEPWVASNIVLIDVEEKPWVSFTYFNDTCASGARRVVFEGAAPQGVTYTWSFPGSNDLDGSDYLGTGKRIVETFYPSGGSKTVTLTVSINGCDSTLSLDIMVDDCGICVIADPGTISPNQYSCTSPYTPQPIIGTPGICACPGTPVEYMWLYSNDRNRPLQLWNLVIGATGPSINDPAALLGDLTQTTYLVRCVRCVGGQAFYESNVVVIEVAEDLRSACEASNPAGQSFSFTLPGVGPPAFGDQFRWHGEPGKLTTYENGNAKLEGLLYNVSNPNMQWYAILNLAPGKDWIQWQAATHPYAGVYASSGAGGMMDHYAWEYFQILPAGSRLIGLEYNWPDTLEVSGGYLQRGVGANGLSAAEGLYAEFAFFNTQVAGTASGRSDIGECTEVCLPAPKVASKLLLQGPYDLASGTMSTALASGSTLPLSQPFATYGYTEPVSVPAIPAGVVDWILVQVRSKQNPATIVFQRAAFLRANGDIVALSGQELLSLDVDPRGEHYIALIGRGHLGVMSDSAILRHGSFLLHDFRLLGGVHSEQGVSNPPLSSLGGGLAGLTVGDTDLNGVINSADFNGVTSTYFQAGYRLADLDFNGIVNSADFNILISNYFKLSHLPD